jgi:translation initiation factor 6 (eIF-6)
MAESKPNIVVRDTPGGSVTRGGLAGVLAWGLALVAANNGVAVDPETLAAAGAVLAGGVSALIRFVAGRVAAAA